MKRQELPGVLLRAAPFQGFGERTHRFFFGAFAIQFAVVWLNLWTGFPDFGTAGWPIGLLLVLCAGATLTSLARQLPAQNVLLASVIVAVIAGATHAFGARMAIPFGPYTYADEIGLRLFHTLPLAIPLIWLVAVFSSRGVARLMMRPWRKTRSYGFWVMGLTVALIVLLDLGLEPFASRIKGYWHWDPTYALFLWYTTPWVNFLGWAATATIMLAFATPALINKKPVKQPADFYPLATWLLVNGLFLTGALVHELWAAAIVESAGTITVAILAIKGGRW